MAQVSSDSEILERFSEQEKFYSRSAGRAKQRHDLLQSIILVAPFLIPFLLLWENAVPSLAVILSIFILIISSAIGIAAGLERLHGYGDKWLTYRVTREALRQEKNLYFAKAGPYRNSTVPSALLAERFNSICQNEVNIFQLREEQRRLEQSENERRFAANNQDPKIGS